MPSVTKPDPTGPGVQSADQSTNKSSLYTDDFLRECQAHYRNAITRIILKVLEIFQPTSVIDVGCGMGTFLATFQELGIKDIQGIDGAYVHQDLLVIPKEKFMSFDLEQPLMLDRTYDLVVCLEVAEHLSPQFAADFVASLTRLGSIILFSAAIPYQDGTGHLNEQWPEYWADLFKQHGFFPVDALRRSLWHDQEIPFWYRQNMLFFCSEEALANNEKLAEAYKSTNPQALSLVHPELYLQCHPNYVVILQKIKKSVGKWKNSLFTYLTFVK